MKKALCVSTAVLAAPGWMTVCRYSPRISGWWLRSVMRPASAALSGLTAAAAFPWAELLAAFAAVLLGAGLLNGVVRAVRGRPGALRKWAAALSVCAVMLMAGYGALWYPAYWAPEARPYGQPGRASAEQLRELSLRLIRELEAAEEPSPDFDPLLRAAEGCGALQELPYPVRTGPKAARYPEWMRKMELSGIYMPYTAEAVVNPQCGRLAGAFTACHELAHACGIADEGQANIAAWRACMELGGEYGVSARLWALKYAMAALREQDEEAWTECAEAMQTRTERWFAREVHGFFIPDGTDIGSHRAARMLGLYDSTRNYGALADYLCDSTVFYSDLRNHA